MNDTKWMDGIDCLCDLDDSSQSLLLNCCPVQHPVVGICGVLQANTRVEGAMAIM